MACYLFQSCVTAAWSFGSSAHVSSYGLRFNPVRCSSSSNERQALFSRIAPVYDNVGIRSVDMYATVSALGKASYLEAHGSFMEAKVGDDVLDLCCGTGDLTFLLSEKVGITGKVTGLDFSKEILSVASLRQDSRQRVCFKNIEWVEGDALNLPFSDCCFDAITMGYGLRNVVDKHRALQEILRVLRPGSKVSILDFNKSSEPLTASIMEWMIDNIVVPVSSAYGLAEEYRYIKSSIREFLTGKDLEKLALDVGYSTSRHYEIGGGLMGILVAKR